MAGLAVIGKTPVAAFWHDVVCLLPAIIRPPLLHLNSAMRRCWYRSFGGGAILLHRTLGEAFGLAWRPGTRLTASG